MDYTQFKTAILNTLKRVHPDVNPAPTAAAETRALLNLLEMMPSIQKRRAMTIAQAKTLLEDLKHVLQ